MKRATLVVIGSAVATALVAALLLNVAERKREAKERYVELVDLSEETIDPAMWGKNFPRQYDAYLRTVDTLRTKHGGSEAFSKLAQDPAWVRIFDGYAFSLDYREERGHAYMLTDQDETRRVLERPQPGACVHCHASVIPAYRKLGNGDVMKGFDVMNAMTRIEARTHVSHPIACIDCHDPETMELRVTRPGFLVGIRALKASQGVADYDVNRDATRQEMRSYVCGQCHVEYYFRGEGKTLTYPWSKGIKVEQIEAYYDSVRHADWTHPESKARVLKAQHPEFETWSQGIHARSGVACADCHMPYKREGAIKISDHHIRSPLLNVAHACRTCHHYPEEEIRARAEAIQDRTAALLDRGEIAVLALLDAVKAAQARGATDASLETARDLHRKAQWRLDFVSAENSMGFHASQETARILAEAIDYARQGEVAALRAGK
ncbi:MAG TPA: ammonia-forming cytochrome c nitrite reductase subunit c552 [Candidatus Eisenbacteria bacterium]|nr:ammonia-forming cytochrome c nitrite reductase subunit c552 [Candidatus Eisenbacteria bacterium]